MTATAIDSPILAAALALAEQGFSIFPCAPRDKHPITSHGFHDASRDFDIIAGWWQRNPNANIGLPTGPVNGVVVLDWENAEGETSLAAIEAAHAPLPATLTCRTGRGRHLYFAYTGDDICNSEGRLGEGLDVRGNGGYVIASPSIHPSGAAYAWDDPTIRPAPLPDWLRELMIGRREVQGDYPARLKRAEAYARAAEHHGEGARNGAAFRLAGTLWGQRLDEADVVRLTQRWNEDNNPPLPDAELLRTIQSARVNGSPRGGLPDRTTPTREADADDDPPLDPINLRDLLRANPERAPAVVNGLLREGSVGTLIGASKSRKSWAVGALVGAVMTGGSWFGNDVVRGRVALVDGELTAATLNFRLRTIFAALAVGDDVTDQLDIFAMRGRSKDNPRAMASILGKGQHYYKLIIVDPLYTLYPPDPRFSENDNAAMRRLYDQIITLADQTRAAVLVVHHLSKGTQSEKSLTDLGAGAGAIARAGDSHLSLRQHREKDCVVLDGAVRDFVEVVPSVWEFKFPLYFPSPTLDPTDLAGLKRRKAREPVVGPPEPWTPEEFAAEIITAEPAIREQVEISGKAHGLKVREIGRLLNLAVVSGLVVKTDGTPGRPAKFARPHEAAGGSLL